MHAGLRRGLAGGVVIFLAAVWAVTLAQRFGGSGWWWLELMRFLPYPLLLVPCALAFVLAWPLGWGWRVASAATFALVASVGMGLSWRSAAEPVAGSVRLMTWNAKTVQASERSGGIEALMREVAEHRPDIVVMQDANALRRVHDAAPAAPMLGLPYVWGLGQYLVASRFPLEGCADVTAGSLTYARCTVHADASTFELRTVHFESPRAGLLAARHEGAGGVDTWLANLDERLLQSRSLAASLAGAPRPLIVAGDLNAAESSDVVGQLLAGGLRDAFSSAGRGFGYTYGHTLRPRFSFLRIDHILVSPQVTAHRSFTGTADASDHRPVIADLSFAP